jgi:ubiquinone/menaquinone biosynthesis C-methylase UbiE
MAFDYCSREYAMLNRPIETDRHFARVSRFLGPRPHDRLLEIGCGRGFLTARVQRHVPDTRGVDLNPESIANGVTRDLAVMDAQELAFEDASFDMIYSFHCIEHIPDLARAFREMDRVLKPGGSILLVYPAEPIRGLYVVPTSILVFGNPWHAREIHLHKLTPRRLRPLLAGTTLTVGRSALHLLITPQFITVLRKPTARVRREHPEKRLLALEVVGSDAP